MKLLNKYKNGNYFVKLYSDGTKIRYNDLDNLQAEFPENIDIKITNWCDMSCKFCHENSSTSGKEGDIMNSKFIETLQAGTELAIGGGKVTSHSQLIPFLRKLKGLGIIANITLHQNEFMENTELINRLTQQELVYGIGVSLSNCSENFINKVKKYPNIVIHTINGIHTEDDFNALKNNGLKVLVLGYKNLRRGEVFLNNNSKSITENQKWLYDNLETIIKENWFNVLSFDNLSLVQLDVKRTLSQGDWDEFYMGDDGQYTMYIDMVEQQFARNSTSLVRYDLLDNIKDMFNVVKSEK